MPRWISKVTTVTFAGREILSPGQALENNEIEFSSTFDRSFTPTVARRLYALRSPAHSLNISIPVIREFRDAPSLLAAAQNEIAFAYGANSTDTLSISTQSTPTLETDVIDLAPSTSNQANVRYIHISAAALAPAAGCPCSAIAIQGGTSDSNDKSNLTPHHLGVFLTTENNALDLSTPTLLATSLNSTACISGNANTWNFNPSSFLIPPSANLRLAFLPDPSSTEWSPNTAPYLRAACQNSDGSLGFTSTGNNQKNTSYFPHISIFYARTVFSEATSVSYISAFLTELAHRVTTAPKCLRLISTWTFTIDASYIPPSIPSDSDDLGAASPGVY